MAEKILENIGLSKNESKIYLSLLKTGAAPAGRISETSGVHRTNVYDAMERLITKGLVSYVLKDDVKVFSASDPKSLLGILKEKAEMLQSILPNLALNHQLGQMKTKVQTFEGISPFKTLFYDLLRYKKPIFVYGIPSFVPDKVKNFIAHFHKEREEKGIPMKHIYNFGAQDRIKYLNSLSNTEAKYLPKEYDSPVSTFICGDEVLLTMWSLEPILVIRVLNKNLAESYNKYFELLWQLSSK